MRVKRYSGWVVVLAMLASVRLVAGAADNRLIDAVRSKNKDAVSSLLKQRIDVNVAQPDGGTALHWAAHWDDPDTLDLLIRAGANVNATNELGATPLWIASAQGSAAMVERLLNAGANPNVALLEGETPLMAASHAGSVQAVKSLLAHGADVNAKERLRGQTALMWAAAQEHRDVVQALLELKADVTARTGVRTMVVNAGNQGGGANNVSDRYNPGGVMDERQGGFTPLLFAAERGSVESAKLLLNAGANVDDAAANGASAVVIAAHSGHTALAEFLLDKGANANAAGAGYTALHAALLRGDSDLVKALLAHGADPNIPLVKGTPVRRSSVDWALNFSWVGGSPIWLAAKFGDPEMMRALAAAGGNATTALKDGTTPLMAALGGGQGGGQGTDRRSRFGLSPLSPEEAELATLDTVKTALDLGNDVNAVNQAGDTALHTAAGAGLDSVIKLLVDRGAKLDVKNQKGQTPLQVAAGPPAAGGGVNNNANDAGRGRKSTVELLRKLGAQE